MSDFLINNTFEELEKAYLIKEEDEEKKEKTKEDEDSDDTNMTPDVSPDDSSSEEPTDQNVPDDENPNIQAEPETGTFISTNRKAELAKAMLDAYMADPPEQGSIPKDLLNVTTNNADKVIQYVQGAVNVDISTDEDKIMDELSDAPVQ